MHYLARIILYSVTERGKEVKSPLSSQRHWELNAIIPESLLPQTKRVIKELNTDISYGCDISLSLFPHFPFLFCSMFWFIVGCVEEKKAEKDDSEFPASLALMAARLQLFTGQELTGVRVGRAVALLTSPTLHQCHVLLTQCEGHESCKVPSYKGWTL